MKKSEVVSHIFHGHIPKTAKHEKGLGYAPTNIALCKYWGKRDTELNLPHTSSLSIALPDKGSMTTLTLNDKSSETIILNDKEIALDSVFAQRTKAFLDLFRANQKWYLKININMNIPVAAGLASSASGFASLVCALNDLFDWKLHKNDLSILARLGSGSAARSLWTGFVEWHAGVRPDGMDSFGEPLAFEWPELCVGILTMSSDEKPISSREAMQTTVNSSLLYNSWPRKVSQDLSIIKQALQVKNFALLAGTAESNALAMHATMLSSWPPICYFLPETIAAMHKVWDARKQGLQLYFTEDAGPNLKLLFLKEDTARVQALFPEVEIIRLFDQV